MERTIVESSSIHSIGYDETTRTLEIQFQGDSERIYQYENVPPDVHQELMNADSKGQTFWRLVRDSYQYTRIN